MSKGHVESETCHTQADDSMPANILNLPRLKVTQVEESDHDYHIKAHASFDPTSCPACHSKSLVGFGRNVHPERAMTARLAAWIGSQSLKRTFASETLNFGADISTLVRMIEEGSL